MNHIFAKVFQFQETRGCLAFLFILLFLCPTVATSSSASELVESAYIKSASPVEDEMLGQSIFLEDGFLAIGAVGAVGADVIPSVYTFSNCGSTAWQQLQVAPHPAGQVGSRFGQSVSASKDYLVVGAPSEDGDQGAENPASFANAGAAYVYTRNGQQLDAPKRIVASNHAAGSRFGWSVDLTESGYMIIGASEREHPMAGRFAGAAYIYELQSDGSWLEVEFLESQNPQYSERFGGSVEISDSWAFVGARSSRQESTPAVGAVYVYRKTTSGWVFHQEMVPSDAGEGWNFGFDISLDGEGVAIGAIGATVNSGDTQAGAVYYYRLLNGNWVERDRIEADVPTSDPWFGASVDLDGPQLLVGAPLYDGLPDEFMGRSGALYLFSELKSSWSQSGLIRPASIRPGFEFGTSAAIYSGQIAGGAIGEDSDGTSPTDSSILDAGAVFLFQPADWLFNSRFEACEPSPSP